MKRSLLLLFLPLATAACGEEYTHLRFDRLTQPPRSFSATRRHVQLYEGSALAVKAVAMDGDDPMEDPPKVELWPCDPSIVGVAPALEDRHWHEGYEAYEDDDDDPVENAPAFVLWGAGSGRSCLRVVLDGANEESISVEVIGG
ncbi:hypothetical protein [Vulgatibacter sp.]|uniref:hypothetical protein n=1 Tax=Vulgatibacter sp. TaxID=1971226 RepID=UPI0035617117